MGEGDRERRGRRRITLDKPERREVLLRVEVKPAFVTTSPDRHHGWSAPLSPRS
jgi:hypothetical protein